MSLQSAFELSQDPAFKGKVLIALSRAAKKVIEENDSPERVQVAKDVLGRAPFFAEAIVTSVAADKDIDSSSNDDVIAKATLKAIIELVR